LAAIKSSSFHNCHTLHTLIISFPTAKFFATHGSAAVQALVCRGRPVDVVVSGGSEGVVQDGCTCDGGGGSVGSVVECWKNIATREWRSLVRVSAPDHILSVFGGAFYGYTRCVDLPPAAQLVHGRTVDSWAAAELQL
jgi:hypothetical protein